MYRKPEPVPIEETSIWLCEQDSCTGWMRQNFSFEKSPVCPFCSSDMVQGTKLLPVLVNKAMET